VQPGVVPPYGPRSVSVKVRSTLLASSRRGLFDLGHREAYVEALGDEGEILVGEAAMVAQWVDLEVALRHYRAADSLGLSESEMVEAGNAVGARVEGALWGTVARAARRVGFSPWPILSRLDRVWGRMYRGDAITVRQVGPKDARIEVSDNPLADVRYWRVALTGLMQGATLIFARSAHVRVAQQRAGQAAFDVSWA